MKILHWEFSNRFENYINTISAEVPLEKVYLGYTTEAPPQLWRSHGLHTYDVNSDKVHILLNKELDTSFAELVAAHEFTHEIMNRRGYPICSGTRPETVDVVTHINSALTDPPVNDFISSFGYDASPLFKPACQFALQDWANMTAFNERNGLDLIYNAVLIFNRSHEMASEEWAAFESLCETKTPKTFDLAKKLIKAHEKYGHSTPEATINAALEWRTAFNTTGLKILTRDGSSF